MLPGARDRCDPRRSPTYAAPAFGPRRIVFMLDTLSSKLCSLGGLNRAKQTVVTLLETTSEEDLVAVVMPSLQGAGTCLADGFVRATEGNIRSLQAIVNALDKDSCGQMSTNPSYRDALDAAFDALEGTGSSNFSFLLFKIFYVDLFKKIQSNLNHVVRGDALGLNSNLTTQGTELTGSASCQAALVFITADPVAATPILNEKFSQVSLIFLIYINFSKYEKPNDFKRNDEKIGARLFMYTVGSDLSSLADSPVCETGGGGGSLGDPDSEEDDLLDRLQGFFQLGAASLKATAKRVVRWSAPRQDKGVGPVVTAATPVYGSTSSSGDDEEEGARVEKLLGVVTTDVSVEQIAAKLLVVSILYFPIFYLPVFLIF